MYKKKTKNSEKATMSCLSWSAAWRSDSERRFYDDYDRKIDSSTPIQASLLCPWIISFTII